jgi:Na+/proline symporter
MLLSVGISIYLISQALNLDFRGLIAAVSESDYSQIIVNDWQSKQYWLKQFLSGAFIAIVMTGLDQDMMQKNLSCRNLKDAQKNIITLSWILVVVNLLFLFLGASLFLYATRAGISIPALTDDLFPTIAIRHLGMLAGLTFTIGLIAAAYSSADGALTALTTSFSIDFLNIQKRTGLSEEEKIKIRRLVHIAISVVVIAVILAFRAINNQAVIAMLFTIAGYTYGPLLGLYAFGLFTRYRINDKWVPLIAILSPAVCYLLNMFSETLFNGYLFGFELLIINGIFTMTGLFIVKKN